MGSCIPAARTTAVTCDVVQITVVTFETREKKSILIRVQSIMTHRGSKQRQPFNQRPILPGFSVKGGGRDNNSLELFTRRVLAHIQSFLHYSYSVSFNDHNLLFINEISSETVKRNETANDEL